MTGEQTDAALRVAAAGGEVAAMIELALRLWPIDDSDDERLDEVGEWLHRAAETGDVTALFRLGQFLFLTGDEEEAEPYLRRAADAGDPGAMGNLGDLYDFRGEETEAEAWYLRAAQAGDVSAMGNLGALLTMRGETSEGAAWQRRATEAAARPDQSTAG